MEAALCAASQFVKKPVQNQIHLSQGGGARGGGSPPRVGSNALNALLGKAFSERSEDFCTAQRRKSNGIFRLSEKSKDFSDSLKASGYSIGFFISLRYTGLTEAAAAL